MRPHSWRRDGGPLAALADWLEGRPRPWLRTRPSRPRWSCARCGASVTSGVAPGEEAGLVRGREEDPDAAYRITAVLADCDEERVRRVMRS